MSSEQKSRMVVIASSQEAILGSNVAVQLLADWQNLEAEYWKVVPQGEADPKSDKKKNGGSAEADENRSIREVPDVVSELLQMLMTESSIRLLVVLQSDGNGDTGRKLVERYGERVIWLQAAGQPSDIQAIRIDNMGDRWIEKESEQVTVSVEHIDVHNFRETIQDSDDFAPWLDQLAEREFSPDSMLLFPAGRSQQTSQLFALGKRVQSDSRFGKLTIGLVREPARLTDRWLTRLEHFIDAHSSKMEREQRVAMADDLKKGSQPGPEFVLMVCAATFLAAAGLVMNSAAVVIGAMLIAPLMTPILGAGMSLSYGNWRLFLRSLRAVATGFVAGFALSFLFGLVLNLTGQARVTDEMWARCFPSWMDFGIGLVGGAAAAYARTRAYLSSALAGAAIAAALVPPIATAGLQLAFRFGNHYLVDGTEFPDGALPVVGPLLVFLANVLTIMIGSSFVLWIRGVRGYRDRGVRARWGARVWMLLCIVASLLAIWYVRM